MAVSKSFDLSEEILNLLAKEVPPQPAVEELVEQFSGKDGRERAAIGERLFADYGRRWMNRTIDLGEEYSDRTYEMMKQIVAETGLFAFPHIPQRFFEIAYMGLQPIPFLKIVLNNQHQLMYRLTRCAIYDLIQEKCGQEVAAELHCRHACLTAGETLFERLNMKAEVSQVASMPIDARCDFSAVQG